MNTDNLTLTIESDGTSYSKRQQICREYLASNDMDVAIKAMTSIIKMAISRAPLIFDAQDRKADVQVAAANILIENGCEELRDFEGHSQAIHSVPRLEIVTPSSDTFSSAAKIPSRSVPDDVMVVIRESSVDQSRVYLPNRTLDRKLYADTKKVLEALGGKWTGGKIQAFVFAESDPESFAVAWQGLQETGSYTDPKDMSFFPTPDELTDELLILAGLEPGMSVYEPSAGRGAIALKAAKIVGIENVSCVEMFPPNANALKRSGLRVVECDFLGITPPENDAEKFDCVILNPPFSNHQDAAHVAHACHFVKAKGRLVAITSTSWVSQDNNRKAAAFRSFVADVSGQLQQVSAGTFKSSGTMVPTQIVVIEGKNLPWNQSLEQHDNQIGGEQGTDEIECEVEAPSA